jgi:hypothetical protein
LHVEEISAEISNADLCVQRSQISRLGHRVISSESGRRVLEQLRLALCLLTGGLFAPPVSQVIM